MERKPALESAEGEMAHGCTEEEVEDVSKRRSIT